MVKVDNISKSYNEPEVLALHDISFEVKKGELFGIIGPDGAGKTSLFRILTTLLLPDTGSATVNGLDIRKEYKGIREQVGYMPGKFSLYHDLSVQENLDFFASIFGTSVAENYDLIKEIYIQLEPFKKRRAGKLSGGMKQKLALCCALIHKPTVLFLDEPTTGVDTVSRKEFWQMLKRLKQQGITILVSTPYMDEATLCERIALVQEGKILSINTPEKIIEQYPKDVIAVKSKNMSELLKDLRTFSHTESCNAFGENHHITFHHENSIAQISALRDYLITRGHEDIEISIVKPTIEDCFIHLVNKQNEA